MKRLILPTLLLGFLQGFSQPFADIASFNYQTFSGKYDSMPGISNRTENFFLGLFYPKEFDNGNALLIRANAELLEVSDWVTDSSEIRSTSSYMSISVPLGFKLVSKNKKWETIVFFVPKLASNFRVEGQYPKDMQYGGIFLEQWVPGPKLKLKAGLYYNKEAFGNFFVPLVGIDWKPNSRWYMYGILPTNYRVEYNIVKNKLYSGVGLRCFTRSFNMRSNIPKDVYPGAYLRYDEIQLKAFVDYFIYKKLLLFGEVGYSMGKNPIVYRKDYTGNRYATMGNYFIFNAGIAYRYRLDFE